MNRIALIVPYLNRAKWLPSMLDSLSAQTIMPYEAIFVDNGSVDNSHNIVDAYIGRLQERGCLAINLTCSRQGAAAARNAGWRISRAEYIYFFDSDDRLSPNFFEWANQKVNTCQPSELYVIISRILLANGKFISRKHGFSPRACFQIISPYLTTQTMIIHRSLLEKVGGWNPALKFWDDWELGYRLLKASPSIDYDKSHAWHSLFAHPDSITGNGHASRSVSILRTLQQVEELINQHPHRDSLDLIALHYRIHIMAGRLIYESCPEGARNLLKNFPLSPLSPLNKFTCHLLKQYTSHGGRGAWVIAWGMLKIQSILHRK